MNSETDFVAASEPFKDLLKKVTKLISENKPAYVEEALEIKTENGTLNDDIISTTQKTGEKVSLRRFTVVEKDDGDSFGAYLHQGGQIAALVVLEGADDATAKDVAMHVAAINPEFMTRDDVSQERLDHERAIFKEETLNEGKPEKIVDKIVEGRLNKFLSQICLADQDFVKDSDQTVEQYVSSKNGKLKSPFLLPFFKSSIASRRTFRTATFAFSNSALTSFTNSFRRSSVNCGMIKRIELPSF